MFDGCINFDLLEISIKFDTSKVYSMFEMFKNFKNLKTLDISTFITISVNNYSRMFSGCESLQI